jgi:hypothetical protein
MAGVSKFPQLSVAKATHGTPIALKGDPLGQTIPRLMAGEQGQGGFVCTATRGYRQASRASQRAYPLRIGFSENRCRSNPAARFALRADTKGLGLASFGEAFAQAYR